MAEPALKMGNYVPEKRPVFSQVEVQVEETADLHQTCLCANKSTR